MSSCTDHSMTNNHATGVVSAIVETLRTWRERQDSRRELSQWNERDLRDAGLSRGDVLYEAAKPFWRA